MNKNPIKIEFTTNKTSRNVSRKESGATAPAKSHKSKNSNIVENMARKLRSKQVRLSHDQNI